MNLIFQHKNSNLLAQIYHLKEKRARFERLLKDIPQDVRIVTRIKNSVLKQRYGTYLLRSFVGSCTIFILAFLTLPGPQPSIRVPKVAPVVIETIDIPETRQVLRRPAVTRPEVPLQVATAVEPEEVSLEMDVLDLDLAPIDVPVVSVPFRVASEQEPEPVEIWAVEEKPEIIRQVQPEYPWVARKAGLEGTVYLKVLVNKQGQVAKAVVVRGKDIFHQAALDAVLTFEFRPAKQSDQPVDVWLMIPMQFRLTG